MKAWWVATIAISFSVVCFVVVSALPYNDNNNRPSVAKAFAARPRTARDVAASQLNHFIVDSQLQTAVVGSDVAGIPTSCRWRASDSTVVVDIKTDDNAAVLSKINTLTQSEILSNSKQFGAIRARVPFEDINDLAWIPSVLSLRCADVMVTHSRRANAATTPTTATPSIDLVTALQLQQLQQMFNLTGAGISVGVLSNDITQLPQLQAVGLLPNVTVLAGQNGTSSSQGGEGTAILQIIHEIAPQAALFFATANNGQGAFAENILALSQAGCQVIVDDVSYRDDPPLQDSSVLSSVAAQVVKQGTVYVSSAGNNGNYASKTSSVWEGVFTPSESSALIHVFNATLQQESLKISGNAQAVTLWWSDPLDESTNDYNLYVIDSLSRIVGSSETVQNGSQNPEEVIDLTSISTVYSIYVVISKASASTQSRYLRVSLFGGSSMTLEDGTSGSIYGHAAAPGVFGVSAFPLPSNTTIQSVASTIVPESFSDDGPRRVFYNVNNTAYTPGNLLTGGVVRQQPRYAAPDGDPSTVSGYAPSFYGTSAAAPVLAALAALVLQLDVAKTLSPAKLDQVLSASAVPIGAAAFGNVTGNGFPLVMKIAQATIGCGVGHYINLTSLACVGCPAGSLNNSLAMRFNATFGVDSCSQNITIT